ncbi:asparagine--tRNA ligase [Sarracenia purpurea var. burkii]
MAAASALSPASSLRLKPFSTIRFLSVYRKTNPKNFPTKIRIPTTNPRFRPKSYRFLILQSFPVTNPSVSDSNWRSSCTIAARALSSGEAVENSKKDILEEQGIKIGDEVGEFRKRLKIVDIRSGSDEGLDRLGQILVVKGWVRTLRVQSSVTFIEVNDGSCLSNMQCVMNSDVEGYDQKVELKVEKLILVGGSDPSFPIQKKKVSREFLRTKAHLRPRTNTFGAVARVRNALAYATHKFFQDNGFVWISSPIITASDCEGAGEQFCVTTLIPSSQEASKSPLNAIPKSEDGFIDWSQDFFGKPAFLTVSGQLNAETYATALSDVYTFGPTFRAENSNTSRHLAEFWMIEPELAFADLNDDIACATAYLQYVVKYVLEHCKEDMDFFNTWIEKGIINRLSDVVEKNFVQLTYTDAIGLLLRANKKFVFPVEWGCDLQSEHERYITEEVFCGCPVIVRDYPKDIKAFYMRQNDDGKTVAAMDMLVPQIGELIGGSQREERLEYLEDRLDNLNLNKESYWWYLDLRRYGSVPHAGFGLGFERLVQFVTGIENIRDAIPFPRTSGSAEF